MFDHQNLIFFKAKWTDWTESECSVSCGGADSIQKRNCLYQNQDSTDCVGEFTRIVRCNTQSCRKSFAELSFSRFVIIIFQHIGYKMKKMNAHNSQNLKSVLLVGL